MKKIWLSLLFFGLLSSAFGKQLNVEVTSSAAILINANNGRVLFAKNATEPFFPASTTKIAAALYALEKGNTRLDESFVASKEALHMVDTAAKKKNNYTLPSYWLERDGTTVDLVRGESMKLRDLLYAMMLVSGNDAANVVAEGIGTSIPHFMEDLNQYLKRIGCKSTHFCNPHGLHNPNHVTTAYDMAKITQYALKNELFCKMVISKSHTIEKTNKHIERNLVQFNRLIKPGPFFYPYAIGVKTGSTSQAKCNLVAAAKKDDRLLIAVVFGAEQNEERYTNAKRLFNAAFAEAKQVKPLFNKEEAFKVEIEGGDKLLSASLKENFVLEFYPSEEVELKAFVHWESVKLPIALGQRVGKISILDKEGTTVTEAPIFALNDVKSTFWSNVKNFWRGLF